jgi:hypothetical protein
MTVRNLITKFKGHERRRIVAVVFVVFSSVQQVSNLYVQDGKIRIKIRKNK